MPADAEPAATSKSELLTKVNGWSADSVSLCFAASWLSRGGGSVVMCRSCCGSPMITARLLRNSSGIADGMSH